MAYPPAMVPLHFEVAGSRINGILYMAAGLGPHPTVLMLQGFPGNEKNADLSQAMRRAGSNVVNINYRGTWGSEGKFTFANALEDVAYIVAKFRDPGWADRYRSDPDQIAIVGHSFGGFLGASIGSRDQGVACYVHLAGMDLGVLGKMVQSNDELRIAFTQMFEGDMDSSGGPVHGNARTLIETAIEHAEAYSLQRQATDLSTRPLLLVAAVNDQVLPKSVYHDPLVSALRKAGATRVTEAVYDDDHVFSSHRISLARKIVEWQSEQCWH